MTIDGLLDTLLRSDVTLFLDGNRLRYRAPEGVLTPELRAAISEHRQGIMDHLRVEKNSVGAFWKCVTCDRHNWVDAPLKDGRIRTTCGKCGRFIGYRPENPLETHNPLAIPRNSRQL